MNDGRVPSTDPNAILSGKVKWFDASKGFGFITVPGFEADFLLHQNVLHDIGRDTIIDETVVEFKYSYSANGLRTTEIVSMILPQDPIDHDDVAALGEVCDQRVPARVKWFDGQKGYGFVNRYGDGEDIFIGANILKRCGLRE
ncbi:cold shock domain-containing protein, partial [Octadecabacter dasysiphoniae]